MMAKCLLFPSGTTEDEAITNIRTAICDYLEVVDNPLDDAEVREIQLTV